MVTKLRRWALRQASRLAGWVFAIAIVLAVRTCRFRVVGDVRPELRASGTPYVYALLHAHQISAVLVNDEERNRLAAMVSRSADGDLLVPSLTARGVLAARGSSSNGVADKGGQAALAELRDLLEERIAVLFAVDGPRGPRNQVHSGVARIAQGVEGAVVLPTVVVPSKRWFPANTWDRIQVPKFFSTITLAMDAPIRPEDGESVESLRQRIATAMDKLEAQWDPDEADRAHRTRALAHQRRLERESRHGGPRSDDRDSR